MDYSINTSRSAETLAFDCGETTRAKRYAQSLEAGIRFMDRLILRNEDLFMAREPERALGGVRGSMHSSLIRIDFVSHTLAAFLKRCQPGL